MPKRGSVRLLLLFFHPSARLGWRIGAAVALVALAFMAEGSGSVQPGARSALSQLTHQSAWRHALKDEPAQKIWPWEDTLARQRNAVPRLGLSAAVLREASGGANIAPAAPRQGPGAPAEPSRAQLGDVAIGDGIPVPTPDNLFRDYRVRRQDGGRSAPRPKRQRRAGRRRSRAHFLLAIRRDGELPPRRHTGDQSRAAEGSRAERPAEALDRSSEAQANPQASIRPLHHWNCRRFLTGFFGGAAAGGAGVTASAVGWLAGVPAAGAPCAGAAPAAAPGAAAPVAGVAVPVVAGVPAGVGVPGCNAAEGCCSNWLEVPPTDPGCGTRPVVGASGRRSSSMRAFSLSRPTRYSAPMNPSSASAFQRFSGLEPEVVTEAPGQFAA